MTSTTGLLTRQVAETRLELAWTRWGEEDRGVPLFLVMGLSGTQDDWEPVHHELARTRTVITLDNRGMGSSRGGEGNAVTLGDMASDVVALVEHLGYKEIDLLGWSMGGMIVQTLLLMTAPGQGEGGEKEGMQWDLELPFKIRKVVLVATACKAPGSDLPAIMKKLSALAKKGKVTDEQKMEIGIEFWRAQYQDEWLEKEENKETMQSRMLESLSGRRPAKQTLAQSRALFDFDLRPWKARMPKVPILVIHGKKDRSVYFDEGLAILEAYPQAKLSQFEEMDITGHWWFDFKPKNKVKDIVDFLDHDSKL